MSIKRTLLNSAVGLGFAAGIASTALAEEITVATVNNADMIVNRHPIVTPYRRPKLTPLVLSWPGAA